VGTGLEISVRLHLEAEVAVASKQVEHVVEEADPVAALDSPPSRSSESRIWVSAVLRSLLAVRLIV